MNLSATNPWYLLLVFINLLILLTPVHPDHLAYKCSDGPNYTLSSTFDTNLNNLISTLSTNGPTSGFYNASTGENPNQVHGLVLCRGDTTTSVCQSCLNPAVQEVIEVCPNRREAIIWYPDCFIRYSDREFFGIVDINSSVLMFRADQNKSQMDDRGVNAQPLMYGLADRTPLTSLKYAVESESFGERGTRYGLMQCTRDLSSDDCKKCLEGLMKDFETSVVGKKGWRILAASCNIRYEAYQFYEEIPSQVWSSLIAGEDPVAIPDMNAIMLTICHSIWRSGCVLLFSDLKCSPIQSLLRTHEEVAYCLGRIRKAFHQSYSRLRLDLDNLLDCRTTVYIISFFHEMSCSDLFLSTSRHVTSPQVELITKRGLSFVEATSTIGI